MKYKVGDRVKIVSCNSTHEFRLGELVEIITVKDETRYQPYECKSLEYDGVWWVYENEIVFADYTWEDFLKAPIGTKVTFENGNDDVLIKVGEDKFWGYIDNRIYDELENFEDEYRLGKIIKIEEPTYTIVYEHSEKDTKLSETMPEIEEMKRLTDELCKTCDEFIKKMKESK